MLNSFDTHPFSNWYEDTVQRQAYPDLETVQNVDVCIIGSGFTGVSATLDLAKAGLNVVLLEQGRISCAASGRNGGQVWTGYEHTQQHLEKKYGKQTAKELWLISQEAKVRIQNLCDTHSIEADLIKGRSVFTYHQKGLNSLEENANYLAQHYNYNDLEIITPDRKSDYIKSEQFYGGLMDHDSGHLNPLRMALGMVEAAQQYGAAIYEHTPAENYAIKGDKVHIETPKGKIIADKLVLACNALIDDLTPSLSKRFIQLVGCVATTEPLGDKAEQLIIGNHAVSDTSENLNYFRMTPDGRLLFGGAAAASPKQKTAIDKRIRAKVEQIFPQLTGVKFSHHWYGPMAFTVNQMPHCGVIDEKIYYSHGYSGLGVTLANMNGAIIAEAILGNHDRFDLLSSLEAPTIPGSKQFKRLATGIGIMWYDMMDRRLNKR